MAHKKKIKEFSEQVNANKGDRDLLTESAKLKIKIAGRGLITIGKSFDLIARMATLSGKILRTKTPEIAEGISAIVSCSLCELAKLMESLSDEDQKELFELIQEIKENT